MEFVAELLLITLIFSCWKYLKLWTGILEMLHSLTMLALLHVMALMSQNDLSEEKRDFYAKSVIIIGTTSLGMTVLILIP